MVGISKIAKKPMECKHIPFHCPFPGSLSAAKPVEDTRKTTEDREYAIKLVLSFYSDRRQLLGARAFAGMYVQ